MKICCIENCWNDAIVLCLLAILFIPAIDVFAAHKPTLNQAVSADASANPEPLGERPEESENAHRFFLRQSAVLLNPGDLEAEIAFDYSQNEVPLAFTTRREFSLPVSARVGIVNRLEGFFSFPVTVVLQDVEGEDDSHAGVGDLFAGAKYLLVPERKGLPDIVLSLGFIAPTGVDPYDHVVSTGSGHWMIAAGFEGIQSFDPIVLFGGLDYLHQFERQFSVGKIQPGEKIGYNFGVGFAVNENITLSSLLRGSIQTKFFVDGGSVDDSEAEPISLQTGLTCRISKKTYIEPSVTLGLTEDADDVLITVAFSQKFKELFQKVKKGTKK